MEFNIELFFESETGRELKSYWGQRNGMVTPSGEGDLANGDITSFYLIGELAQESGVRCGAIRFYEQQGLLTPTRHGRLRVFAKQDADRLKYILELRKMGLPVKTIRKLFQEGQKVSSNFAIESLKSTLERHEADLAHQQNEISGKLKAVRQKLGKPAKD